MRGFCEGICETELLSTFRASYALQFPQPAPLSVTGKRTLFWV
jgi:hypothetical protein